MAVKKNLSLTTVGEGGLPDIIQPAKKKYEYERFYDLSMSDFNKRGAEGWRLVYDVSRWSMWEREVI